MDYLKLYEKFCDYCKTTDVKYRMMKRNPNDTRLLSDVIYTEKHHIIPRHQGGNDDLSNLVVMLPEEHYIAHLIRWKAYGDRNDFIAVRFIVNGVSGKDMIKKSMDEKSYNSLIRRISCWKQHIYEFRKNSSWHTNEGLKSLSNFHKGKMYCYDSETNEYVGMFNTNHENILNGKWKHHSKGKISVTNICDGRKEYIDVSQFDANIHIRNIGDVVGDKNPNYKHVSDELLIVLFDCVRDSVVDGYVLQKKFEMLMKERTKYFFKKISIAFISKKFGTFSKFIELYNESNNHRVIFDPKHRRASSYNKAEKFFWYTDGVTNIQVKKSNLDDFLINNKGFYKGRAKCKKI